MKIVISLMLLTMSLYPCSSQTKNFTQAGDFIFDGGVIQEQKWSENLRFERATWYHEFTSVFDLAVYRLLYGNYSLCYFICGSRNF